MQPRSTSGRAPSHSQFNRETRVTDLQAIRPIRKLLLMNLLEDAGFDVSDWRNYRGRFPSKNPKYCYDWSFVERDRVALNLWFEELQEIDGQITTRSNMRNRPAPHAAPGAKSVWQRRAARFDDT